VDTNNDSPLGVASVWMRRCLLLDGVSSNTTSHIPPPAPDPEAGPAAVLSRSRAEAADVSLARLILRKVHLVRPDLIPYPLFIEVYA
jgi:hypothetical protein